MTEVDPNVRRILLELDQVQAIERLDYDQDTNRLYLDVAPVIVTQGGVLADGLAFLLAQGMAAGYYGTEIVEGLDVNDVAPPGLTIRIVEETATVYEASPEVMLDVRDGRLGRASFAGETRVA